MVEKVVTPGLAEIRDRTNSLQSTRTEKTRERIREAARELIISGSVVTVKAIAEAAEISRGTFYSHYVGVNELGVEMMADDLQSRPFSIGGLVDLYLRNRVFYRRALQGTTSRAVLEEVVETIVKALCAQAGDGGDTGSLEMLARFTAWGYIGTLDWWLREDEPLPPVALVEFLHDRTPAVFAGGSD